MTINTNISAVRGQVSSRQAAVRSAISLERLSTGLRINHASDDPSGLVAATALTSEIAKLAAEQSGDDRLFIKAAFAGAVLGSVSDALRRVNSINVQNANSDALSDAQRDANQRVVDAIVTGIEHVGVGTTLLGERLFGAGSQLQSVASNASTETGDLDPTRIGVIFDPLTGENYSLADLRTGGALADGANTELAGKVIEASINQIAGVRGDLGSFQQTLVSLGNVRGVAQENLASALSQIQDADYAVEVAEFVRNQTLAQTSIAATAIANRQARNVLSLLA